MWQEFKNKRVLVTGGTGFIGRNLVSQLVDAESDITCLARGSSNCSDLTRQDVRLMIGDLRVLSTISPESLADFDFVFHLAGATNVSQNSDRFHVNIQGTKNLAELCRQAAGRPVFVHVSSLAAVGPSRFGYPHQDCSIDSARPISEYGRSKLAAEQSLYACADKFPISIVRPPVVLGPYDSDGLEFFRSIDRVRIHPTPGYRKNDLSVIHVDDLVTAMLHVALRGERIDALSADRGIYFAAADEVVSFYEFGRLLGRALNKRWFLPLPCPRVTILLTGMFLSMLNRCCKQNYILNLDKAREVCAGSWSCSSEKLKQQTGWAPAQPLAVRLKETVEWYRENQWL